MNVTREKPQKPIIIRERQLTWQRIMRTFKRIGIHIDVSSAHPKLTFNASVSRYLNSHDTDTEHCKRELYRVLDDLSIPHDTFFAALK